MDEDELEDLQRSKLQASSEYDTFGEQNADLARKAVEMETEADKRKLKGTEPVVEQSFVPTEMIVPVADGIGMRLLQAMGWRPGKGVGHVLDALDSSKPSASFKQSLKDQNVFSIENTPLHLLPPKMNSHGLGFDPFKGAEEFRAAKRERDIEMMPSSLRSRTIDSAGRSNAQVYAAVGRNKRKKPHGIAFGSGVLDDDDDGSYGILDDYVEHDQVESYQEYIDSGLDNRGLPTGRGPTVRKQGLGDRLAMGNYAFEVQELDHSGSEGEQVVKPLGQRHDQRIAIASPPQPELLESIEHHSAKGLIPGFVGATEKGVQKFPIFPPPKLPKEYIPLPLRNVHAHHGASMGMNPKELDISKISELEKVKPPKDIALKHAIEKLAIHVIKYGPAFEDVARKLQEKSKNSNEHVKGHQFEFLIGGEGADYYRWRVKHLLARLKAVSFQNRYEKVSSSDLTGKQKADLKQKERAKPLTVEERRALLGEAPLPKKPVEISKKDEKESHGILSNIPETSRKQLAEQLKSAFVKPTSPKFDEGPEGQVMKAISSKVDDEEGKGSEPVDEKAKSGRGIITAADLSRSSLYVPYASEEIKVAARKGIPVRWTEDWRPDPLLCKRFDVPDPFKGRKSAEENIQALSKFRAANFQLIEPVQYREEKLNSADNNELDGSIKELVHKPMDSSQEFIPEDVDEALKAADSFLDSLLQIGVNRSDHEDLEQNNQDKLQDEKETTESEQSRPQMLEKPANSNNELEEKPIDLFKAIFENDSSNDMEDTEENTETEDAQANSCKADAFNVSSAAPQPFSDREKRKESQFDLDRFGFSKLRNRETMQNSEDRMAVDIEQKIEDALQTLKEAEEEKRRKRRHRHRKRDEKDRKHHRRTGHRSRSRTREKHEREHRRQRNSGHRKRREKRKTNE